jgi:tetratricopeptide (TPR) repeat protein
MRQQALTRLGRVADLPAASYGMRVEAARAFAAAGGSLERTPQSEVDFLRAPTALTGIADPSRFVDGRIAAAQRAADPAARVNSLRAALAADPRHPGIRMPLFRAELAVGKPRDAIEAIAPMLARNRSLSGLGITAAERTRLARELADAHQRIDQLSEAIRFFTIALDGENAAGRLALRQRIASLNEEINRRAQNAARRPQIRESVDQPQLVRPLIPPKPPAAAVSAGGAR